MKYISDEIGNEYRSWYPGTAVLIATQTGSGKSTFVFNRLLKNAVEHSKYLVYICNRRALEEQTSANVLDSLAKELDLDEEELNKYKKYLHIVTYQGCEKRKEFPSFKRIKKVSRPNEKRDECKGCDMELVCEETKRYNDCIKEKFKNEYRARHDPTYRVPGQTVICEEDIMYYVFDEAHYFVADSLFNKDTNYWTPEKLLRKKSISVFLTATPEPLPLSYGER